MGWWNDGLIKEVLASNLRICIKCFETLLVTLNFICKWHHILPNDRTPDDFALMIGEGGH